MKKRMGIVSFAQAASEFRKHNNSRRISSLKEISEYATTDRVTHILFPGDTIINKRQDAALRKKYIQLMLRLFPRQSIIFEIKPYGVYAIQRATTIGKPIRQILVTSRASKDCYFELWQDTFIHNNRIRELGGIRFLIWVCGEINILRNSQLNRNKVTGLRYAFDKKYSVHKLNYDVFVNPTHNMLTNLYNKYKERLKYMSRQSRTAIINLNVDVSQKQRTGSLMVFRNGKELINKNEKKEWYGKYWVMEIIDV